MPPSTRPEQKPAVRIPVTVIGGYLGAGKTTLLNAMLRDAGGRRLAVLVNDFGSINIDEALIDSRDNEKISLSNGCVCCSIADDLATVLEDLSRQEPPPEHVVIEASGVAAPAAIGHYGNMPGYRTDALFVVVDAERTEALLRDKFVGGTVRRQLDQADIFILSKLDLLPPAGQQAISRFLEAGYPDTPVAAGDNGASSLGCLVAGGGAARRRADQCADTPTAAEQAAGDHPFETWSFSSERLLEEGAFKQFADALPPTVLRAKGILQFADTDGALTVYQQVGRRWSFERQAQTTDGNHRSHLVLIGHPDAVDPQAVAQQLGMTALVQHPH